MEDSTFTQIIVWSNRSIIDKNITFCSKKSELRWQLPGDFPQWKEWLECSSTRCNLFCNGRINKMFDKVGLRLTCSMHLCWNLKRNRTVLLCGKFCTFWVNVLANLNEKNQKGIKIHLRLKHTSTHGLFPWSFCNLDILGMSNLPRPLLVPDRSESTPIEGSVSCTCLGLEDSVVAACPSFKNLSGLTPCWLSLSFSANKDILWKNKILIILHIFGGNKTYKLKLKK